METGSRWWLLSWEKGREDASSLGVSQGQAAVWEDGTFWRCMVVGLPRIEVRPLDCEIQNRVKMKRNGTTRRGLATGQERPPPEVALNVAGAGQIHYAERTPHPSGRGEQRTGQDESQRAPVTLCHSGPPLLPAPPSPQGLGTLVWAGQSGGQGKRAFRGRILRMAYFTGHSLHDALSNVP